MLNDSTSTGSLSNRVLEIVSEELGHKACLTDSIRGNLGADSLEIAGLIFALEDEFAVDIPDDEIPCIVTVQNIVDYIWSRMVTLH